VPERYPTHDMRALCMALAYVASYCANTMSRQSYTGPSISGRPQRFNAPPPPPQPCDGDSRHMYNSTRLTKFIITLLALVCAGLMNSCAYARSHQVHRDKSWDPQPRDKPPWHLVILDPPALLFLIASMLFTALCYAYHASNRGDVFQRPILILGTVSGLLVALSLDTGILLGICGLEPWFLLLSLVLSDFFHLVFVRQQRCEEWVSHQELGDEKA
jgi:hypothetical protein